jgi:hypothetical protein
MKPGSHFEQIPLAEVMKRVIQEESPRTSESILDNLTREPASKKTEPYTIRQHLRQGVCL